jgi:hypothetical protein
MNESDLLRAAQITESLWSVESRRERALKDAHAVVSLSRSHLPLSDLPKTGVPLAVPPSRQVHSQEQSKKKSEVSEPIPAIESGTNDDLVLEHLVQALANQARREDQRPAATQLGLDPFYSLPWLSRFLLGAVHRAQFSYRKTARMLTRILGEPVTREKVAVWLWRSRKELALARQAGFPPAIGRAGASCPKGFDATGETYESLWASRLLDDEIPSGVERLQLQNHLMACDSCRAGVGRYRVFWQTLDHWIPGLAGAESSTLQLVNDLLSQERELRSFTTPSTRPLGEVLVRFFQRREAQLVGLVLVLCLVKVLFF